MKKILNLQLLAFRLVIIVVPLLAFTTTTKLSPKEPATITDCVYTYILEAEDGLFTVSILSNQTINPPYHTTATAQVTLKVPTGKFEVTNLENLIEGVEFSQIPLFSFKNGGDCTGQPIMLMENFTDPFYPPNSERANVSQQITVAKTGSDLSIVCIDSNTISDCGERLSKKDLKRLERAKNSEE